MTSRRAKKISVLLGKRQIDFLRKLAKRIERESHKKMSRSEIMKVLTRSLTRIKPGVGKWRSEKEIEKELLKSFKKAVKELKK